MALLLGLHPAEAGSVPFKSCSSYVPSGVPECQIIQVPNRKAPSRKAAVVAAQVPSRSQNQARTPASALSLEQELRALVAVAGGTAGAGAFRLPDSNQFSAIPQDAQNPITAEKVRLGAMLFHDTATGINPVRASMRATYSCASCHHVDAGFSAGVRQGLGEGGSGFGVRGSTRIKAAEMPVADVDVQPISSPAVINLAWQNLMLWNGQFGANGDNRGTEYSWTAGTPKAFNHLGMDGLEIQAIAGQGVHRLIVDQNPAATQASILVSNPKYSQQFERAFPELPADQRVTQVNAGKAIAAYERTVISHRAPFQAWLGGSAGAMNDAQKRGALVFFGEGRCVKCHNGPSLASMDFHAIGLKDLDQVPGNIIKNPAFSEKLGRGGFTGLPQDMYRFKVPQLYNLKDHAAFGHGSSFASLRDFIVYMDKGFAENPRVPADALSPEFGPLGLSEAQRADLLAFLEAGLYDSDLRRYMPSRTPGRDCMPNSDPASRSDPYSHCP